MISTSIRVVMNDELEWSRGKRSAHAAHAVLSLLGIAYTHAVLVLNAKPRDMTPVEGVYSSEYGTAKVVFREEADALAVYAHIKKSDTRDRTAALAAHSVLTFYGVPEDYSIYVVSGTRKDVLEQLNVIRDQGRTEIPKGSVTAGASWA